MAAFCGLAAVGVALLLGGATGWAAACAVALLGMLVGAEIDIMGFVAKTHFPMAIYGAIYGSVFALFHLGNAIGASAIAALQSASGSYGPALVGILLLLAIIALAFATLDRSSAQTAAQAA